MTEPFDPNKDDLNKVNHHISLERAFDMEIIRFIEDERFDYGEVRYRAWGYEGKAYHLAFTIRDGAVRPISLRRARDKEMKKYAR